MWGNALYISPDGVRGCRTFDECPTEHTRQEEEAVIALVKDMMHESIVTTSYQWAIHHTRVPWSCIFNVLYMEYVSDWHCIPGAVWMEIPPVANINTLLLYGRVRTDTIHDRNRSREMELVIVCSTDE